MVESTSLLKDFILYFIHMLWHYRTDSITKTD